MSNLQQIRVILVGVGNLGRRFVKLLTQKQEDLAVRYRLDIRLVAMADSQGAAIDPLGLDAGEIARVKEDGGSVADLSIVGQPGISGLDLIHKVNADVLCEASPVNLDANGEPGLSHVRTALEQGLHVITPNKGPIVLAYRELVDLASAKGAQLKFDGTVAGGLPALYIGARDMRGATIKRIESVPNLTTGFILDLLAKGIDWQEAKEKAQSEGALEADPTWDLDGWDAAAKLAILADVVLDSETPLDAIKREGISKISVDWVRREKRRGRLVRLVADAEIREDGTYDLAVTPTSLSPDHPLGRLGSKQMGIVYETDIYGTITAIIDEPTPLPSAATMLRDLLDIYA